MPETVMVRIHTAPSFYISSRYVEQNGKSGRIISRTWGLPLQA